MKHSLSNIIKLLLCGLLSGALGMSLFAQEEVEEEVYELSPFVVEEGEEIGYLAQTSLAGTRLKTDLRDLGSAITVLTEELLDDLGATDAETVLQYVANTEVGGTQGNFAGFGDASNFQRASTAEIRLDPQSNQRVRGLSRAALTRNYFLTNIPFDSYNTTRTTLNRGPNSLLFGIGEPGGVINNDIRQAMLGRSFGRVSLRLGERSSHRETIDFNQEIIEDRLAIRLMGLYEDTQYQQRPAFEYDKRYTIAAKAVLLKNENIKSIGPLTLRGSYEFGRIDGTPPDVIPPSNHFIDWYAAPDPSLQEITGTTFPAWVTDGSFVPKFTLDIWNTAYNRNTTPGSAVESGSVQIGAVYNQPDAQTASIGLPDAGIQGFQYRILFPSATEGPYVGKHLMIHMGTRSFIGGDFTPGFTVPTINDPNVWDNENKLLYGRSQQVIRDWEATNVVLEQLFLEGDAGIELAYDKQDYEGHDFLPFGRGNIGGGKSNTDVRIDVSESLPNGEPNPNLGRPFITHRGYGKHYRTREREVFRATGFYNLDFTEKEGLLGWFGRHVFSGLYNNQEIVNPYRHYRHGWTTDRIDIRDTIPQNINVWVRDVVQHIYVGPSALDTNSWHDIRLEQVSVPMPQDGDLFNLMYFDRSTGLVETANDFHVTRYLVGGNINSQEVETESLGWQSFLLNDYLVGLVGWRSDSVETYSRVSNNRLPNGVYDENNLVLKEDPDFEYSGDTFTWSLVGHVPYELPYDTVLSFHYGESENLQPTGVLRDSANNILSPPAGTTKEYGFTLTMLDRKVSARFNWFETAINGANAGLGGLPNQAITTPVLWWRGWNWEWQAGTTIEEALANAGAPPGYWNSYEEAFAGIISELVPPEVQAVRNFRMTEDGFVEYDGVPGEAATTDYTSEGFEFELAGNITPSWRVFLNISKQETVQDNTAPALREIIAEYNALLAASPIGGWLDIPAEDPAIPFTFQERFDLRANAPLASFLAKDGTVSHELRKWRANLVTTYKFDDGFLDGFYTGLGVRWQDKIATGYPLIEDEFGNLVPDVTRPFMDAEQFNGDLWIGYTGKLTDKIDWRIQLNARNAFGDSDPITVRTNPDGNIAVIRNPVPKEFFITNTFSF